MGLNIGPHVLLKQLGECADLDLLRVYIDLILINC
jgi:hypothetical protein